MRGRCLHPRPTADGRYRLAHALCTAHCAVSVSFGTLRWRDRLSIALAHAPVLTFIQLVVALVGTSAAIATALPLCNMSRYDFLAAHRRL